MSSLKSSHLELSPGSYVNLKVYLQYMQIF